VVAYLMMGKKWGEGGGSIGCPLLLQGWRREVRAQRSRASVTTRRWQIGLAGMRRGEAVPYLSQLRALHGWFKPTQVTVPLGRAQSFTQKLFHLFKLTLTCKLRNQTLLCSKIYPTLYKCILNFSEQLYFWK
jgi:hypothetical protein